MWVVVIDRNRCRPAFCAMLNSHQVTMALTSAARPKVKITKYMPDRRSVASPTKAESTIETATAASRARP